MSRAHHSANVADRCSLNSPSRPHVFSASKLVWRQNAVEQGRRREGRSLLVLGEVRQAKLLEHAAEVGLYSIDAEANLIGDLPVGGATMPDEADELRLLARRGVQSASA